MKYVIMPFNNQLPSKEQVKKFFRNFEDINIKYSWYLFGSIQIITLSSNNINASIEFIDETSEMARKYMLDIINLTMLPSLSPHPLAQQIAHYFASIDYYIVISTNKWDLDTFKEFIDYFGGLQLEIPD